MEGGEDCYWSPVQERKRSRWPGGNDVLNEGGEMGKDQKFYDASVQAGFNPGANNFACSDLEQDINNGIGESVRTGRQILVKRIEVRANFALPTQTVASPLGDIFVLSLYRDRSTNGGGTNWQDVYDSGFGGRVINAFPNWDNQMRIEILREDRIVINPTTQDALAGTCQTVAELNYSVDCNFVTTWKSDGAGDHASTNGFGVAYSSLNGLIQIWQSVRIVFEDY